LKTPKREDVLSKEEFNLPCSSKELSKKRLAWLLSVENQLDLSQKNIKEMVSAGLSKQNIR